jgi:hypothetical protein
MPCTAFAPTVCIGSMQDLTRCIWFALQLVCCAQGVPLPKTSRCRLLQPCSAAVLPFVQSAMQPQQQQDQASKPAWASLHMTSSHLAWHLSKTW